MKVNRRKRAVALAAVTALLAVPAAVVAGGCGEDAESDGPQVTLRITRDFGRELIAGEQLPLEGHETVLKLLRENHDPDVSRYGFVGAIDGLKPRPETETQLAQTWALNINGIETDASPGELALVEGDEVQFDLRDWYVTRDVRATVGQFPKTFTNGILGVRPRVRVLCAPGYRRACREVRGTLHAVGVDTTGKPPKQPPATPRLRRARDEQSVARSAVVLVGPWERWRDREFPERIDRGTRYSGVFGRFTRDGSALRMLDSDEKVVRTAGPGTGLVAAMRPTDDLLWIVTGVDRAGVERAARTFDPKALRDAFAVAVTDLGVEKLPPPARPSTTGEPPEPVADADFPGRLVVRAVSDELPDADGPLYELSDRGSRRLGSVRCRRVHFSPAGPGLCLRVAPNGFDYEAVVLDDRQRPVATRRVDGIPSRVRVSPDGRYGAYTNFAAPGQGYFFDVDEFATYTRILDMRTGRVLRRLETLAVSRDGRPVDLEDAELWGVTFGAGGRFYATLAPAVEDGHLLIEGDVDSDRARVVADHVECPSLSPDGSRIAYKRRIGKSNRWRLHVLDLHSGDPVELAETRSIDDQPEWLGDDLVAYSDGEAVYAVPADGGGDPQRVVDRATSPAWLPGGSSR